MNQATDRRKRIVYVITRATRGGAQKYVYDLATNLPKNTFEPIVLYGTHGPMAVNLSRAGVRTEHIRELHRDIALLSDAQSFLALLRIFKELQPDVVHLNSSKAAALGALAARLARVPVIVFTVHGWPFKETRNLLWRALVYVASALTALLSHVVIVVSRTDERIAAGMWIAKRKTRYVPLGMAAVEFLPPAGGFQALFDRGSTPPLRGGTLRLVTVAELTPNKGVRYAIGAVAELKRREVDCVYVIVGDGEERPSLERLAAERGVNDRVFFAGFIENAAQCLRGFDAFILPSIKEGTPYALLEATLSGIPIVATSVVDVELQEGVRRLKLVPPRDEYALADAVQELARLPRTTSTTPTFPLENMLGRTIALYAQRREKHYHR